MTTPTGQRPPAPLWPVARKSTHSNSSALTSLFTLENLGNSFGLGLLVIAHRTYLFVSWLLAAYLLESDLIPFTASLIVMFIFSPTIRTSALLLLAFICHYSPQATAAVASAALSKAQVLVLNHTSAPKFYHAHISWALRHRTGKHTPIPAVNTHALILAHCFPHPTWGQTFATVFGAKNTTLPSLAVVGKVLGSLAFHNGKSKAAGGQLLKILKDEGLSNPSEECLDAIKTVLAVVSRLFTAEEALNLLTPALKNIKIIPAWKTSPVYPRLLLEQVWILTELGRPEASEVERKISRLWSNAAEKNIPEPEPIEITSVPVWPF